MTRRQPTAVEPAALVLVMVRRAARPALAVGVVALIGAWIAWGWHGLVGGAIGIAIVVCFYATDLLVLRLTSSAGGGVTAAALLTEYVVKIALLAVLVWALQKTSWVDLHALAVTVVAVTVAWVVGLTVAAMRARSFIYDEPAERS